MNKCPMCGSEDQPFFYNGRDVNLGVVFVICGVCEAELERSKEDLIDDHITVQLEIVGEPRFRKPS